MYKKPKETRQRRLNVLEDYLSSNGAAEVKLPVTTYHKARLLHDFHNSNCYVLEPINIFPMIHAFIKLSVLRITAFHEAQFIHYLEPNTGILLMVKGDITHKTKHVLGNENYSTTLQ